MRYKLAKVLLGTIMLTTSIGMLSFQDVHAEEPMGWREENGVSYWYENGKKQGTEGRGKEIYDPQSDAWYWLDAIDDGKMAVSKDVYQESEAGAWGDYTNSDGKQYGKWVRYDENGHMVKGWNENENGTYFFDYTYGTMAKGYATIDGKEYYFNEITGVLEREFGRVPEFGWKTIDGNDYWYEGFVRQGYSLDKNYRGKEIYDPESDAWYWLDNIDAGKKAVNKDVYQESLAGDWGEAFNNNHERIGKWVRYDRNGHMVKGWSSNENGKYYFDPIYGTMAKGYASIDGKTYYFNEVTGVCEGEAEANLFWHTKEKIEYNDDNTLRSRYIYDYEGTKTVRRAYYIGNQTGTDANGNEYTYSVSEAEMLPSYEYIYEYYGNGERSKYIRRSYTATDGKAALYGEYTYTYRENGTNENYTAVYYDTDGKTVKRKIAESYDANGILTKSETYNTNSGELALYSTTSYKYDGNGYLVEAATDYTSGSNQDFVITYKNDANGNVLKMCRYYSGTLTNETVYTYSNGKLTVIESKNVTTGQITGRSEYSYDANGNRTEERTYAVVNKELRLSSRYAWEYDGSGHEILEDQYAYSYNKNNTQTEIHKARAISTYTKPANYESELLSTYDSYYGHYTFDANGNAVMNYTGAGEFAYSSGYEYIYDDNGIIKTYISYTRGGKEENYQKVVDYRTQYNDYSLGNAKDVGQTERVEDSVTYDKNGNRMYYTVCIWKAFAFQ